MRLVRTPPLVPNLTRPRSFAVGGALSAPGPALTPLRASLRLFVAAVAIRLAYCLAVVPLTPADPGAFDYFYSSDGYCILARTWYHDGKFAFHPEASPTLFRTPGYVIPLVAAYALLGNMALAATAVNCIASGLTCVLIHRALAPIAPREARWSAWALALFPLSIHYCARSFDNTFITLTTTLFVVAAWRMFILGRLLQGAYAGAALGFAILTKPVALPFVLVLPAFAAVARRRALPAALLATVVALLVVSPWTLRNYRVSGEFIPLGTGSAFNLLAGTYLADTPGDSREAWQHTLRRIAQCYEHCFRRPLDAASLRFGYFYDFTPAAEREFATLVKHSLAAEPWIWVKKPFINLARFWYYSSGDHKAAASLAFNLPMLALAIVAGRRLFRHREPDAKLLVRWLATFAACYILIYALINVHSTRYSLPVLVWLVGLAPVGAAVVWPAARKNMTAAVNSGSAIVSGPLSTDL